MLKILKKEKKMTHAKLRRSELTKTHKKDWNQHCAQDAVQVKWEAPKDRTKESYFFKTYFYNDGSFLKLDLTNLNNPEVLLAV